MDDGPIKSVRRAFAVVEALSRAGGLTVSELAAELELPVSTAHNYLSTLTETEFVVRQGDVYRPGTRFLEVGERRRRRMAVARAASDEVPKLAAETGEHASLVVDERGRGVVVDVAEGREAISLDTFRGVRMPLHTVAPGKAILANLPDERVAAIIDRHGLERATGNTITDRDALARDLEEIRERGYAVDEGERMTGMTCIAAPIHDASDRVRGAVCACGPSHRIDGDRRETIVSRVRRSANVIQVTMVYS